MKVTANTAIVNTLAAPLVNNMAGSIALLEDDTTNLSNRVDGVQGRINTETMKIGDQNTANGEN